MPRLRECEGGNYHLFQFLLLLLVVRLNICPHNLLVNCIVFSLAFKALCNLDLAFFHLISYYSNPQIFIKVLQTTNKYIYSHQANLPTVPLNMLWFSFLLLLFLFFLLQKCLCLSSTYSLLVFPILWGSAWIFFPPEVFQSLPWTDCGFLESRACDWCPFSPHCLVKGLTYIGGKEVIDWHHSESACWVRQV